MGQTPIPPPTTTTASTPETPPAGLGAPAAIAVVEPAKPGEPSKVEDPAKPAEPKVEATPFVYTELKLPEGVVLDEKLGGEFASLLNDPNLSRAELGQKLIDLQVAATREASENGAKEFVDLQAKWVETIKADPVVGGANFEPNVAAISQLLDKYGDADARAAFDSTGAGNNPAIFRMFAKMSKDLVTEGKPLVPGAPVSSVDSLAAKLYTHTNSQGR